MGHSILNKCIHILRTTYNHPDLAFINQESPLGGDDRPFSGFKNFNTPSQIAQDVVETGFDMVNGANNHSLDQGDEGVLNHLKTWNKFDKQVLFTGILIRKGRSNDTSYDCEWY